MRSSGWHAYVCTCLAPKGRNRVAPGVSPGKPARSPSTEPRRGDTDGDGVAPSGLGCPPSPRVRPRAHARGYTIPPLRG